MRFDELDQTDWIRLIQSLDQVEVDWGGLDQEAAYMYVQIRRHMIERQIDRDIRKINAYGLYIYIYTVAGQVEHPQHYTSDGLDGLERQMD